MRPIHILGHPPHPLTVHFPLAILLGCAVCDLIALLGLVSPEACWQRAFELNAVGLLTAGPAVLAGVLDYAAVPMGAPQGRTLNRHALAALSALTLFGVSLAFRWSTPAAPPAVALFASVAGGLTLALAGWLGAELVYRYGQGVQCSSEPLEHAGE